MGIFKRLSALSLQTPSFIYAEVPLLFVSLHAELQLCVDGYPLIKLSAQNRGY